MCRANHQGGRRCPGHTHLSDARKAQIAKNRTNNRHAKKKLQAYLESQGLTAVSEIVDQSPPSAIPLVVSHLALSTEEVQGIFGDTSLPKLAGDPSAQFKVSFLVQQRLAEATAPVEDTYEKLSSRRDTLTDAEFGEKLSELVENKTGEDFDLLIASMTSSDRESFLRFKYADEISEIESKHYIPEIPIPKSSSKKRAQDIEETIPVTLKMEDGYTLKPITHLGDGIGYYKDEWGEFKPVILNTSTDEWEVGKRTFYDDKSLKESLRDAPKYSNVKLKKNPTPEDTLKAELEQELRLHMLKTYTGIPAWYSKSDKAKTIRDEANNFLKGKIGKLQAEKQNALDDVLGRLSGNVSKGNKVLRQKSLEEKIKAVYDEAIAQGKPKSAATRLANKARKALSGTPTSGGGFIPNFNYSISDVPDGMSEKSYKSFLRSGVVSRGKESVSDYPTLLNSTVDKWGFKFVSASGAYKNPGFVASGLQPGEKEKHAEFLKKLPSGLRKSVTRYTGGDYTEINSYLSGRNLNQNNDIKKTAENLRETFKRIRDTSGERKPYTAVRGTRVPSAYAGDVHTYAKEAFPIGGRVEFSKCTSFSKNAAQGASWGSNVIYVVTTRDGMDVTSVSQHSGENETILGPGSTPLRVVDTDINENGRLTVFMVGEDLVAEADQGLVSPDQIISEKLDFENHKAP